MRLSVGQLDKLSDLFIDLAKGLFLAALAVPSIVTGATFLDSIRVTGIGILFTYLSLKTTEAWEVKQKL